MSKTVAEFNKELINIISKTVKVEEIDLASVFSLAVALHEEAEQSKCQNTLDLLYNFGVAVTTIPGYKFIEQKHAYGSENEEEFVAVFEYDGIFWQFKWGEYSYYGPELDTATLKEVHKTTKLVEVFE